MIDSILAALLRAGDDVLSLMRLLLTGLPEWPLRAPGPPPTLWQTGIDIAFLRRSLCSAHSEARRSARALAHPAFSAAASPVVDVEQVPPSSAG